MFSEMQRYAIATRFPEVVRQKITKVEFRYDDLTRDYKFKSDRIRELRKKNEETEAHYRLRSTTGSDENRQLMHEQSSEAAGLRQKINLRKTQISDLEADVAKVLEERKVLSSILDGVKGLFGQIENGRVAKLADRKAPSPRKGEAISEAVSRCRGRIAQLQGRRAELEIVPVPANFARERARREIEEVAESGRPNVSGLIAGHGRLQFAKSMTSTVDLATGIAVTGQVVEVPDSVALVAWLFRDKLIEAVGREIDAKADGEVEAMTPTDRKAAIQKIDEEIEATEFDECRLIEQGESAGVKIMPRADVNVRAFLNLSTETDALPIIAVNRPRIVIHRAPAYSAPVNEAAQPKPAHRDEIWQ